jgi:hypothetical protein
MRIGSGVTLPATPAQTTLDVSSRYQKIALATTYEFFSELTHHNPSGAALPAKAVQPRVENGCL